MYMSPEQRLGNGQLPNQDPSKAETERDREMVFDATIEALLIEHSEKVNEGNNGIIFRLDAKTIPEELLEKLRERGVDLGGDDRAIKLLKVYSSGAAEYEFGMQKYAHEAVTSAPNKEELARVPTPLFWKGLDVGDETLSLLRSQGFRGTGNKIEVLFMDFVPGEDLAVIYAKEALKRHPKAVHLTEEALNKMSASELMAEVARVFEFKVPGGSSRNEAERGAETDRVFMQNADLMYKFLEEQGFVINPSIAEKIRLTLKRLHERGIYLRDGHPRNFMVVGDYSSITGKAPEIYFVDFGKAKRFEGDYYSMRDELYTEDGVRHVPDESVLEPLKRFIKHPDQKIRDAKITYGRSLDLLAKRFVEDQRQADLYEQVLKDISGKLEYTFGFVQSDPEKVNEFIALVYKLVQDGKIEKDFVLKYLEERLSSLQPFARNKVVEFYKYLKG